MMIIGIIFSTIAMNSVCTVQDGKVSRALHIGDRVGTEVVTNITKGTCVTNKRTLSLKKDITAKPSVEKLVGNKAIAALIATAKTPACVGLASRVDLSVEDYEKALDELTMDRPCMLALAEHQDLSDEWMEDRVMGTGAYGTEWTAYAKRVDISSNLFKHFRKWNTDSVREIVKQRLEEAGE